MLLNCCHKKHQERNEKSVVVSLFCLIFLIGEVSSLARVDNNWPNRISNVTVAFGGLANGQPIQYNHNNQAQGQQQWLLQNNRSTHYQQPIAPVTTRPNQTASNWNQSNYNRNYPPVQGQTRPVSLPTYPAYGQIRTQSVWPQPKVTNRTPYPSNSQGSFNQSRPSAVYTTQNPAYGQASYNQSRPVWPQASGASNPRGPQYPAYGQGVFFRTHAVTPQPSIPKVPNQTPYPAYGPGNFNQGRPAGNYTPQNPSFGLSSFNSSRPTNQPLPNNPQNSASSASHLYPLLPNNPNRKPVLPTNSWSPPANQTLLYPKLPNQNVPPPPPAVNYNGIPLAPLQPQINPQGPHNWYSGGQSALSYGPGYYPSPADNSNKTPPNRQGSSNPYANMFI